MKLSLWMIANRLSPLMDLTTEISQQAAPVLNSARLAYSTNCAHVYAEGSDVVCDGEGDRIILHDIDVKEAFEIIQGVFDFYQDWEVQIQEAVDSGNYQVIPDCSDIIFQNPMILMDGNCRILGLSNYPEMRDIDPEWDYLCRYGYSSLNSMRTMRYDYSNIDFEHYGCQTFQFDSKSLMFGGVSYCMQFNGVNCGRLTVLSKNRPLNAGDYQLVEKIARMLEPRLGAYHPLLNSHRNVFYNLLTEESYNDKELDLQLTYQQWLRTDTYQIALVQPYAAEESESSIHLLSRTIARHMQSCVTLSYGSGVLILANWELDKDSSFLQFIQSLLNSNPVNIAFSLSVPGITAGPYLVKQAAYTIARNKSRKRAILHFQHVGLDYLLNCDTDAEKIYACHPAVAALWKSTLKKNDGLYETLKMYLDCERSLSQTAAALYTHRNTVLYRIRKCQELLGDALEDPGLRIYLRISMKILEMDSTVKI